jgi:mRNA interferase MazF
MITSNTARGGHPSRVAVSSASPEGRAMGLRLDSVVMTDNLATVLHVEIDKTIGQALDMQPYDNALRHTLGL